jgi:hypothetical protein
MDGFTRLETGELGAGFCNPIRSTQIPHQLSHTIPFDTQSQYPPQDVLLSFMTALPPPPIRNRAHLGSQQVACHSSFWKSTGELAETALFGLQKLGIPLFRHKDSCDWTVALSAER